MAGTAGALRAHRACQATEGVAPVRYGWSRATCSPTRAVPAGRPSRARVVARADQGCGGGARRFHASRHTCATLLLNQGVPSNVVSAILGHANLGITSDIYAKVDNDTKRRALAVLAPAA